MGEFRFRPWIGPKFGEGGRRIFLIGESHIAGDEDENQPDFTVDVVEAWRRGAGLRFFTSMARALTGAPLVSLDRSEALQSFAFYNYIQNMIGVGLRPTPDDFSYSNPFFRTLIQEYIPTHAIVFSKTVWFGMPRSDVDEFTMMLDQKPTAVRMYRTPAGLSWAMPAQHPSRAFSAEEWTGRLRAFLALPPLTSKLPED